MWIKRSKVIDYANQYLKDITLQDLFWLSKNIKIEVDKQTIETTILEKSNGEVSAQLDYYDKFVKALKIHAKKALQISFLLEMVAGVVPFSQSNVDELDITIDSEKVLKSDVDRLLHPLKHICNLMQEIKQKAENYETYINDIEFVMPKSTLLNLGSKYRPDEISLTEKQLKQKHEEHQNLTMRIIEKYQSSHNV